MSGSVHGEMCNLEHKPVCVARGLRNSYFYKQWIRLFDFYSGKCLAKVAGHSELATGVRFTPDGRRLVSTGGAFVVVVPALVSKQPLLSRI